MGYSKLAAPGKENRTPIGLKDLKVDMTVVVEMSANRLGDTSWKLELDEFLEDIRLNRIPTPGLREGRRVLEIVERIYEKSGYKF